MSSLKDGKINRENQDMLLSVSMSGRAICALNLKASVQIAPTKLTELSMKKR